MRRASHPCTQPGRSLGTRLLVLAWSLAFTAAPSLATQLTPVALTDQPVPGLPGVTYSASFSNVVIGDSGLVAFVGELQGAGVTPQNNLGFFSGDPSSATLIARSGTEAPGAGAGVNFVGDFSSIRINNVGQTAIQASLTGAGVGLNNDGGLWSEGGGPLGLVAREGDPATGLDPGVNYGSFFAGLELNDLGRTAYVGGLTGAGVNASNNQAIWSQRSGSIGPVARAGNVAPDVAGGPQFSSFGAPSLSNSDSVVFGATLVGGGVTAADNAGLWSDRSGSLALVAQTGTLAPDTSATLASFSDPILNNADQVAFRATLTGVGVNPTNDSGLWSDRSGSLDLVVRTGDVAPDTGGATFAVLPTPAFNDAGFLAFDGDLTGAGVDATNDRGIWAEGPGGLQLVVRKGMPAPGTPNGVVFSNFSAPLFNTDGQVALLGLLNGTGVGALNARGIWATDRDGILQLIAREGDEVELGPNDTRTIALLARPRTTQLPGVLLNELGQYAFWATFTDGTAGVVLSNVVAIPEPAAAALCWTLVLFGLGRRTRPH